MIGLSMPDEGTLEIMVMYFTDGLWPEMLGIIITVAFIDRLYRRRDDTRREQELQERLLREARSNLNHVALHAVSQLRDNQWLDGPEGRMKDAFLEHANLENAVLNQANLENADLTSSIFISADLHQARLVRAELEYANFTDANLWQANLENAIAECAILTDANLWEANLEKVNLENAILIDATLWATNLTRANLRCANLQKAKLEGANLKGADLVGVIYDTETMLPDGSPWNTDVDMARFTDPAHPDFWKPSPPNGNGHKPPQVTPLSQQT
jgi:uncharacterized protein YjbI with pentapeptide repeats